MYVCAYMWGHACHSVCGAQGTTCRSWFSPCTMWVQGIELGSPPLRSHLADRTMVTLNKLVEKEPEL